MDSFEQYGKIRKATLVRNVHTDKSKGYGFIEPEDGSSDVFVHITAVQNEVLVMLFQGQVISYDLQPAN